MRLRLSKEGVFSKECPPTELGKLLARNCVCRAECIKYSNSPNLICRNFLSRVDVEHNYSLNFVGNMQKKIKLFQIRAFRNGALDPNSLTLLDPRFGLALDVLLCDLDDGGHADLVDLVAVDGVASDVPPAATATEPDLPVRAFHLKRGQFRDRAQESEDQLNPLL